ncbi:MAG: hypothetical protein WBR18_03120 [Anaerolineales bacterium]
MSAMIWATLGTWITGWLHPTAYLDPGSGSYLIQLLIASIMGALILLRVYWSKVIGFFRRLTGKSVEEDDE